jgi:hypothetical protein
MVAFQFYLQSGKQRGLKGPSQVNMVGGGTQSLFLVKEFPVEEEV